MANEVGNVGFVHPQLIEKLAYYQVLMDSLQGELVIKWRRERYLPRAQRSDKSLAAQDRYETILADAVYYNVPAAHADFMTGQVFQRPPTFELPEKLKPMLQNMDGAGTDATEFTRRVIWNALCYSRAGIFVDYPAKNGEATTVYELDTGLVSPILTLYEPWHIINWRTERRGGKEVLTLVVLQEVDTDTTDGFDHIEYGRLRVLRLDEQGNYEVLVFRSKVLTELARFGRPDYNYFDTRIGPIANNQHSGLYYTDYLASFPTNYLADFQIKSRYELVERHTPTANGVPLTEIPFVFVGANSNTVAVERPFLFDIASVNLGLYRDSALNQQMLRVHGSGTPWFAGLNRQWIRQVMGGKLALGSSTAIKLPTGGTAGMLQGVANSSIREAMQDKWNYMAALGARVLSGQQSKQKTATEFSLEAGEFNSGLALVAISVAKAMTIAMKMAGKFIGVGEDEHLVVDLLIDYGLTRLSPQQRHQLMVEVQGGLLSWSEGRALLHKAGVASVDDEEAKAEIDAEKEKKQQHQLELQEQKNASLELEMEKDNLQARHDGGPKEGEKAGPQTS